MIELAPRWTKDYPEFWDTIQRRNIWFIHLRYSVSILIFLLYFLGKYIFDFKFSDNQTIAIILLSIFILFYNVIIHITRKYVKCEIGKFNKLHLSFLQIVLDLSVLFILVYYTGGKDSPISMFFIFHMIIGSLILPNYLIYSICIMIIICFSTVAFLQHYGILSAHLIENLNISFTNESIFSVIVLIGVFSTIMLVSVIFTTILSRHLLTREHQLRNTLVKLNEAEVSKQKYIIAIVHELKTPIAAATSFLDLILSSILGPVSNEVKDKIIKAKKRTTESIYMINNILQLSKIKLLNTIEKKDIQLTPIIKELVDSLYPTAAKKNINLAFPDIMKDDIWLKGDKELLKLAFSNLISNAVKYTPNEGIIIISISNDNENLIISISDNGIGIPEQDIDKVFNQFYRASNVKNEGYEGTGTGLSVVKEIIENHGGKVEIESPSDIGSKERPGTSFVIILPFECMGEECLEKTLFKKKF